MGGSDVAGVEPLYVCFNSAGIHVLILLIAWFRLFVGDLSNDVSDAVLANAFKQYESFTKARVIRDRRSEKVRVHSPDIPCALFFLNIFP